ncbi:hypothetical protein DFH09DRAFT_1261316 [Mycena vulgaris]|nr:hypothetical protein DFH09DRAFT_1261316 [Mycena vulgaris]
MAQVSPVASDDASDSGKTKRKSPSKAKKEESEVEDSEPQSDGEGGDDGDEEEYEIEAILDAKKGQFEKNKLGYFVKWKGYTAEHNSWVIEEDAANATDLIKAFWAEREKKKAPKKAPEVASKRSRKSVGDDNASDAGGSASASVAKKRGRKSSMKAADPEEDAERPAKKPRKTSEKKTLTSGRTAASAEPIPDDSEIGNMAQHMHAPTWDQLIKHIDTVERIDDTLFVYFTLHGGERIMEDSKICADKFPKMLLQFYESNLRWKEAER